MAKPKHVGTKQELRDAIQRLHDAKTATEPLFTDNFNRMMDKMIHALKLRIARIERTE